MSIHTTQYWNRRQLQPNVVAGFSSALPLSMSEQMPTGIILPTQTHSANVGIVRSNDLPKITTLEPSPLYPDTDALITQLPNITIGIRTADCVPILLYDPDIRAIAAIHAGWKGTLNGIVDITIKHLIKLGTNPENIYAYFGPSICPQCYEIDHTLAQQFINAGYADCISNEHTIDPLTGKLFADKKPHLDLVGVNTQRLENSGVLSHNIDTSSPCTRHTLISILEDNDLLRNTFDQYTIETANSLGNSNPNRSSISDNKIPVFHSWRREPGTTNRIITAITLLP